MEGIVCGDSIKVLSELRDKSVSLVVTSPPYHDCGKEYETKQSLDDYREFARKWTSNIGRILTDDGSFWLNVGYVKLGANETMPLTYLYHGIVELPMVQEIIWHYEGGMSYKKRFTHRTERWMWFAKNPDAVKFNLDAIRDISLNRTKDKRNNPAGKNPSDYWFFNRVTNNSKEKTCHPCQFPEKMISRIVLACSDPDELVVDPFGGSMTTAVVAKRLGRRYLCIEQSEVYCEVGRHRINNEP